MTGRAVVALAAVALAAGIFVSEARAQCDIPTCANGGIPSGTLCGLADHCGGEGVCIGHTPGCPTPPPIGYACDPNQPPVCVKNVIEGGPCTDNSMCAAGEVCYAVACSLCGSEQAYNACVPVCPE